MHVIADISSLTEEEKELILAAVRNGGRLEIAFRAEMRGRAVVVGRRRFFCANDPSVASRYLATMVHLRELELIHEVSNQNAYELTNFGWQLSRKLGR